ncbi:hypothetical protein FA10DRAFT_255879 [Acaromyces ingoldii]|uniref:Nuclear proteasome inhibitor UBLCP1 n=1 Tax=Acaromyces ingoldii TaxID=215250 RepID=A0A316YE13_9BASI|nr:hypothetical protein FA10DRAFT_255879 [Acaromyces ingoldii]PWN87432.1 hypothetical protein FA10DRAFT_255879 [Acaromyces ingoldii]
MDGSPSKRKAEAELTQEGEPVEAIRATAVEHYCFSAKYGKSLVEVRLAVDDTVADLKAILFSLTDVPADRQKLLGLTRGKLPADEAPIADLIFPPTSLRQSPHPQTGEKRISINLVGTPLDQTFKDPDAVDGKGLEDDEDDDAELNALAASASSSSKAEPPIDPSKDPYSLNKLEKTISRFSHTFPLMAEPRPNLSGGLLVLDLDYTIADTKKLFNYTTSAHEAERPGLHDFLAAVYPYYDICVWSQTSHWWLEAKLTEMGLLTDARYRISFVLDRTVMFSVRSSIKRSRSQGSKARDKHEVKALEIIWRRFPQFYGPHNTIHVDDLSRNFVMNPSCGLKIAPYKNSPSHDTELVALQRYLLQLAHPNIEDFRILDGHHHWKHCLLPSVKDAPTWTTTTTSYGNGNEREAGGAALATQSGADARLETAAPAPAPGTDTQPGHSEPVAESETSTKSEDGKPSSASTGQEEQPPPGGI